MLHTHQVKYRKHKLCSLIHGPLPAGCKCNCPKGRLPMERSFNWTLDGVRGRVEKIIGQVVHHAVRYLVSIFIFSTILMIVVCRCLLL